MMFVSIRFDSSMTVRTEVHERMHESCGFAHRPLGFVVQQGCMLVCLNRLETGRFRKAEMETFSSTRRGSNRHFLYGLIAKGV